MARAGGPQERLPMAKVRAKEVRLQVYNGGGGVRGSDVELRMLVSGQSPGKVIVFGNRS